MSCELCPAECVLWESVHIFVDDKITVRTYMYLHKEARIGFLMLREDFFQKTKSDQVGTCYFTGVLPLLRSYSMGLVWTVRCVNA